MATDNLPLRSDSIFLKVHHSARFREDLLMPSEVNVGLLTVCNFCHNVSKTIDQISHHTNKRQYALSKPISSYMLMESKVLDASRSLNPN